MGKKGRKKITRTEPRKNAPDSNLKNAPAPKIKRPPTNKRLKLQLAFFLGILAFILYANTLKHEYAFDDQLVITRNTQVQQGLQGIPEIMKSNFVAGYQGNRSQMYRPFTISMFAIEWSVAPNNSLIGHFMNCLFYALTAMVLFLVMCRIFVNRPLLIPFLATLLFVVHPIHTEVVANIKSRDELMSLFFSLLAFLFMFRFSERKKITELFFTGISYFAALMFKETAAVLIVIFPLLLYFFTDAGKKDYLKVMAFIAIPLVIQLIIRTVVLQEGGYNYAFTKIHNILIDADGFWEKSASIFMLLGRHLLLLFFPHPLSSDYSYNQIPLVNWSSPGPFFPY
jgi:protein O-mannosyl-transferase